MTFEIKAVTVPRYEVDGVLFDTEEAAKAYAEEKSRTAKVDEFIATQLTSFKPRTVKRIREVLLLWEDYKEFGPSPEQEEAA